MKFLKSLLLTVSMCLSSVGFAGSTKVEFTPENTVVLRGEVTGESVAAVMSQIIASPKDKLYLFISSPGGSIIDGLRLVSLLHSTDKDITCVTNMAASMAFVILQACTHRLVTEDAVVMQHVAAYSLKGQEPNNWSMAHFIRRMVKKMDEAQAKRIGLSYTKFKSLTRDDWWLFDGEAVTANVADGMAAPTCNTELAKKTHKETVQNLFMSAEVTWSDCPLIEGPVSVKMNRILQTPEGRQALEKFTQSLNWRERLFERFKGDTSVEVPGLN